MEGFKVKDEPMDALAIDSQVMVNFLYETAAGILAYCWHRPESNVTITLRMRTLWASCLRRNQATDLIPTTWRIFAQALSRRALCFCLSKTMRWISPTKWWVHHACNSVILSITLSHKPLDFTFRINSKFRDVTLLLIKVRLVFTTLYVSHMSFLKVSWILAGEVRVGRRINQPSELVANSEY